MADPQPPEVIPLGSKECTRAGELLGRVFHDDPLWSALMPDPDARRTQLAGMFTAAARTIPVARGVAERTAGFEAVALWLPPGKEFGPWAIVRSGFALPRFGLRMSAPDRKRMLAMLRQFEARRKKLVPEPHWYLMAVGVEPEHQGRGRGSALVRSGLAKADHENTLTYLETETHSNVGYYERLGFEVVEEMEAIWLQVPLWLMIRPARTGND